MLVTFTSGVVTLSLYQFDYPEAKINHFTTMVIDVSLELHKKKSNNQNQFSILGGIFL